MSLARTALAVLVSLFLLPMVGTAVAEQDNDLETTCLRTRASEGDDLATPVLSTSGTSVTVGIETAGSRVVLIVTPDACVPDETDLDKDAHHAHSDARDPPDLDKVAHPLLP